MEKLHKFSHQQQIIIIIIGGLKAHQLLRSLAPEHQIRTNLISTLEDINCAMECQQTALYRMSYTGVRQALSFLDFKITR